MREKEQRGDTERGRSLPRKKTQREKDTHVLRANKLSVIKCTLTSMK